MFAMQIELPEEVEDSQEKEYLPDNCAVLY
jgi:hypothetical protein